MVFYPIRILMCPNLLMVGPSQGHVLLICLSYLMIRTCIGKQMDTSVRNTYDSVCINLFAISYVTLTISIL